MREHRTLVFHNRTLILDGQRFSDCRFINIDLRYKGTAPFELRGSSFEGYVNLEFLRECVDAPSMAAELERAFHEFGYDLELLKHNARTRGSVWRLHTLLPRKSCSRGRQGVYMRQGFSRPD
jgi:hypothetical protein